MKIDINGVIRDMTEEEEKEYLEAIASQSVVPATAEEVLNALLGVK